MFTIEEDIVTDGQTVVLASRCHMSDAVYIKND